MQATTSTNSSVTTVPGTVLTVDLTPTGFLEESPGVRSSTRLVLVMSMIAVLVFVLVWMGLCVHANLHKPGVGILPVPTEAIVTLSTILAIPATLKRMQFARE